MLRLKRVGNLLRLLSGFLCKEDGFNILQENNDKILTEQ